MPRTRNLFKAYPACRYKSGNKPMIVKSKGEDELALSNGWAKTPIKDVLNGLPPALKDNVEVVEKLETVTDKVAAVVNMLVRIEKVRSKRDLRWLAAELEVEMPGDGYSLKELRKMILDEARIHPDFAAMYQDPNASNNPEGQNYEHSTATH